MCLYSDFTLQGELKRRVLDENQNEECHLDTTNYCTYVQDGTKYLRIGKSKDRVVGRKLVDLSLALTGEGLPFRMNRPNLSLLT